MRHLIITSFLLCLPFVSQQALAVTVLLEPPTLGELPDDVSAYPGDPNWGDGIIDLVGVGTPGETNNAIGDFSCMGFGCFDNADVFFINIPVGLEVTNIHMEANPGDAERFILTEVGSASSIFNITAFSTFDYTNTLNTGLYLVEAVNGQQKEDGIISGFGSAGGNWRMEFLTASASPVPIPASFVLMISGLFSFGWFAKLKK